MQERGKKPLRRESPLFALPFAEVEVGPMRRQASIAWKPHQVINVAAVPHRSPFRYPGGKTWLVPRIRQWLKSLPSSPSEFVEPFAGGATVGLSALFEQMTPHLTLVELDEDVASVWQVLLNGGGKTLAARIAAFDMTLPSVKAVLVTPPEGLLDRAFVTILRNRVQRGGIMAPGASLMKQGENGRGIKSRWYVQTLQKRIKAIVAMRHHVRFIHGDGVASIRDNAHRTDTVFFIDPPYTVAGRRLYKHSEINHEELFRVAAGIKGDFLMSYDNAAEVRTLAKQFGFDTEEVAMKNTHHAVMSELLIGFNLEWARR